MFEKIHVFRRLKELETAVEVLNGRCSLYEVEISSYVDALETRDEAYDKLLVLNERLVNILNEHMLDKLVEVEANNSSLQTITNSLNAADLTLPEGLTEVTK